jgi:hypothetical protein
MRRFLIFALLFPLGLYASYFALMQPTRRLGYMLIAMYVVELVPALLIAIVDEVAERKAWFVRAGCCALAGFVLTPILPWLLESYIGGRPTLSSWNLLVGCVGAFVACVCSLLFQLLRQQPANRMGRLNR